MAVFTEAEILAAMTPCTCGHGRSFHFETTVELSARRYRRDWRECFAADCPCDRYEPSLDGPRDR